MVQAYGTDVYGGAETACRQYATLLAARGHAVEVVTTCARSYVDWADAYPPGRTEVDGVAVNRLSVPVPRNVDVFGPVNGRAVAAYHRRDFHPWRYLDNRRFLSELRDAMIDPAWELRAR